MDRMTGLNEAEKAIYDEFEAGGRALLEKARADAEAIGADLTSIIGATETAVKQTVAVADRGIVKAAKAVWNYLYAFTQFLDDKKGKFSYKRGSGVVALVTSIIFAFRGDWLLSAIYFAGTVAIALFCAIEQK
jgi:hypothetical protein